MSAITLVSREVGPDGIRRYRTTWKVIIHSHQSSSPIVLTDNVVNLEASKNTKTVGNLHMSLVADVNLLNTVFPNDYVNVYCNRADGQGWTRLFFGFIDNIEESTRVDGSGKPTTQYQLTCSDFQKAFERTEIYFNPFLTGRSDFDSDFNSTPNIGGAALRTRGLRVTGGPSDLVVNTVLLLLGFGSQYLLPSSYNPRLRDRIRQQRADEILGRLSDDIRTQIMDLGGYSTFLENLRTDLGISATTGELTDTASSESSEVSTAERARYAEAVIRRLSPGAGVATESSLGARERGAEAYNVLNTTLSGYPSTLLDIIDINTFVERKAIDGYTAQMSMWDRQGSVWSFMNSISNEIVNEMFLDLRPISRDGGLTAGTDYSRDLDDISGNAGGADVAGILYQPSLVMREYPYSTIDMIDASNVPLTVRQRGTTGSPDTPELETVGALHFGAIFSNRPNIPGRHIVEIPTINTEDLSLGTASTSAKKHLDVAVVYDDEITSTTFARSDTDLVNLVELVSESSLLGEASRFFMMDLLPIITPISIVRHGLRTRRLATRFARHSLESVNRTQPQPTQAQAEESATTAPPAEPTPATPSVVLPVELVEGGRGVYTQGFVSSNNTWHYRQWPANGTRHVDNLPANPVPAAGVRYWRFHNGVDIQGPVNAPIRAIRDGQVVMVAPQGTSGRSGYGNVVIIYHPDADIFSLYAHLASFADNLRPISRSTAMRTFVAAELQRGGTLAPVPVRAGDVIGFMGDTDCPGVRHLHFELNVKRNGIAFPSSSQRVGPGGGIIRDFFKDAATALPGFPVSFDEPPGPDESLAISQDPIRVFASWGVTLPVGRAIVDPVVPGDPPDPVLDFPTGDGAEDDNLPEVPVAPTAESTATDPGEITDTNYTVGHVDVPSTRRLLARWGLLNDHWYQHNIEYLSGSVQMRGAPEIRTGYRLDLSDRSLSFYIEGVSHHWSYGQPMATTLHVTRGQPNNPFPVYVLPFLEGFSPTTTQRQVGSRLSAFFIVPDPISVRRSLRIQRRNRLGAVALSQVQNAASRASPNLNETDSPNAEGGGNPSFQSASDDAHFGAGTVSAKYGEAVIEAVFGEADPSFVTELLRAEEVALGLQGSGSSLATHVSNPQGSAESTGLMSEAFDVLGSPTGGVA